MEVQEWRLFDQLEPFSDRRSEWLAGYQMALMANLTRTKSSDKVYKPWDVLPLIEKPKPSPEQLVAQISQLFGRPTPEHEVLVPHERTE